MHIRLVSILVMLITAVVAVAQDPASLMEEGRKLEQKLKDEEAIEKYKQAIFIQPSNIKGVVKCAELSASIGSRKETPEQKTVFYQQAKKFADAALKLDSNNAEANYMMAVVLGKLTEVEKKTDNIVGYVKGIRLYADKAVKLNPQMGKAWHVLGRWHLEVLNLNAVKKAALKVIYGGVGEADIEKAIQYMEKCKTLEPYYCLNFLDLARAYEYDRKYEKSIGLLEQLSKLPTRRQEDVTAKAQGAVLLQKLQ